MVIKTEKGNQNGKWQSKLKMVIKRNVHSINTNATSVEISLYTVRSNGFSNDIKKIFLDRYD